MSSAVVNLGIELRSGLHIHQLEPVYIFPPSSIPVYENIFALIMGGACVWSYTNVLTFIAQCSYTFLEVTL